MSGGSYNYVSCKETDELLSGHYNEDLEEMAKALWKLGYADDAAIETDSLIRTIQQCYDRIESCKNRLSNVWHALEWWESGDSSETELIKSLFEYRKS